MHKVFLSSLIFLSTMVSPCNRSSDATTQSKEDLLISHTWIVKELTYLQHGQLNYYKRNRHSDQFLNDRIAFKKNGTGIYTNTYNQEFEITWKYVDEQKTKVEMVIKDYSEGGPAKGKIQVVNLENINVTGNSLRYSEIYVSNRKATMSSVYRVPVDR
jgi:hypothetical protein